MGSCKVKKGNWSEGEEVEAEVMQGHKPRNVDNL